MKMDLTLNNLQRLICHKTQQTKPNQPKCMHYDFNMPCHKVLSISVKSIKLYYHAINSLMLMICSASFRRSLYQRPKLMTECSTNVGIVTFA